MPTKIVTVTVQWRQHANPDWQVETTVPYYHPLREAWEKFLYRRDVAGPWRQSRSLYNRFGQELLMDYHLCPEKLEVFLDLPNTEMTSAGTKN